MVIISNYYVNSDFDYLCCFVANAFSMVITSQTTPARERKFLQKVYELKDLQNSRNKKIAKFLILSSCSAG